LSFKRLLVYLNILFFFFSCHFEFKNPSDPAAENYIGYKVVTDVNAVQPSFPLDKTSVQFPSLIWSKLSTDAQYLVRVYSTLLPYENLPVFTGVFNSNVFAFQRFSYKKGWPVPLSEGLTKLQRGSYLWNIKVKSKETNYEWGRSSSVFSFNQLIKKVAEGFTNKTQYYQVHYDGSGFSEKREFYSGDYFYESEVTEYDSSFMDNLSDSGKKRKELFKYFYSTKNCTEESLKKIKKFDYVSDSETGTVRSKITYESDSPEGPWEPIEKIDYTYRNDNGNYRFNTYEEFRFINGEYFVVESREYKYDESGRLIRLEWYDIYRKGTTGEETGRRFNIGYVENDRFVRHEIYKYVPEQENEFFYMYNIIYLESEPDLRARADFYFPNKDTGELENTIVYEYLYNIPESKTLVEEKEPTANMNVIVDSDRDTINPPLEDFSTGF
jgi:hypothetical protein